MTKRMLIDSTHAEETRVVVLDGNRLEDFDVETSTKKQLKGNIYLAKVVRVEPSLQAAFVEYGGGRHGFLAFGEIHPDYYQIPVADRQRLLEIAAEEAREEEEAEERRDQGREQGWAIRAEAPSGPEPEIPVHEPEREPTPTPEFPPERAPELPSDPIPEYAPGAPQEQPSEQPGDVPNEIRSGPAIPAMMPTETKYGEPDALPPDVAYGALLPASVIDEPAVTEAGDADGVEDEPSADAEITRVDEVDQDAVPPETIGGESDQFEGNGAEEASRRRSSRMLRSYRIQEVIRRRQILLIQVVKEERGNKGAALTTYISLAGRYCVLMPNSPRGGGISRKITSGADRKRLKEITAEMEIPKGMGLIVRTAGAARPKQEIKRDCEYLMRLWDDIRDHTMASMAPALIYEEASLIKRSIRDVYSRDVDEIIVDGEEGWKQAHDFMRMLMPSHAKKVELWRPTGIRTPLFAKYEVDLQLDAMLAPTVQLKSGGYLVINQTEALVAVDVNSGRSTRERGIEETALKTNLEAADELGRQLRLRDLAGLIVIDFIDMEVRRNNAMVERRMKDALKNDRARIQLGAISHFGLMEMSRQRLRPSLNETSFVTCPDCGGMGHVRSVESSAIHVLRSVEEEGSKLRAAAILVHAASSVVMYLLNNKRDRIGEIEARYAMRVNFAGDDTLMAPAVRIDRLRPQVPEAERMLNAVPLAVVAAPMEDFEDEDEDDLVQDETPEEVAPRAARPARAPTSVAGEPASTANGAATAEPAAAATEDGEQKKRRRRRRRSGRRDEAGPADDSVAAEASGEDEGELENEPETGAHEVAGEAVTPVVATPVDAAGADAGELDENGEPKGRRRGRRGGRRRRRTEGGEQGEETAVVTAPEPVVIVPSYAGPTPADPFNNTYDIFDMLEQAEEAAAQAPVVKHVPIASHRPEPAPPVPVEVAPAEPELELAHVAAAQEPAPVASPVQEAEVAAVPAKKGWWRR